VIQHKNQSDEDMLLYVSLI